MAEKTKSKLWSEAEFRATVQAYIEMWRLEQRGINYKKSTFRTELLQGVLSKRSPSAIEMRMRNISAVMEELGYPRIQGYAPAGNVGTKVTHKIKQHLANLNLGGDIFPSRAETASLKPTKSEPPIGNPIPKTFTSQATEYARDQKVVDWVLNQANGICESCGASAPFLKKNGQPYLEVHHLESLKDGGADTVENCAALCPICHAHCHHAHDAYQFNQALTEKIHLKRRKTNS